MSDVWTAVYRTELPGLRNRGKVRDVYALDERLMIVATDRISAFDVVMDQPIPGKGALLTRMSQFWLQTLPACSPHHLEYVVSRDRVPAGFEGHVGQLVGRAMVVRQVEILPVECIVRGYIIGSGWRDYLASGVVSGVTLPKGLKKAQQLPEPIFTPSTKATVGHDEPLTYAQAVDAIQRFLASRPRVNQTAAALMGEVRRRSLEIYRQAAAHAADRGIILADTKFEFGLRDGELLLADEVLTPDSSRFWPRDRYQVGENPPSFDKQHLRDYLETLDWNKQPPPPPLPDAVIAQTREKYADAYRRLTGATVG